MDIKLLTPSILDDNVHPNISCQNIKLVWKETCCRRWKELPAYKKDICKKILEEYIDCSYSYLQNYKQ